MAATSLNLILGYGGMVSFGHAVYTGLGSFIAIHAMNLASEGSLPIPLVLGNTGPGGNRRAIDTYYVRIGLGFKP